MPISKLERKLRFSPYLPYGFCSQLSTTITGKSNRYATTLLLGNEPEKQITACKQFRENVVAKSKYLVKKKFARDTKYACGKVGAQYWFRTLTKTGLAVLTEAPIITESEQETKTANDGKIKEGHFRSNSQSSSDFRELLYEYALSPNEKDQKYFQDLLFEAVINGETTPLTGALPFIEEAKIGTSKYSPNQLNSIWRISNITAMFRANDYLTYLDRRPYDTGFAIDRITDDETYQAYLQKYGYTTAAISYRALNDWYKAHPGYYQFSQQFPDDSEEAKEAWLHTPAFYASTELPNWNDKEPISDTENVHGSQQKIRSSHLGLAIGKSVNYLCYHGRAGEFSWRIPMEQQAKGETERTIHDMKTQCPEMPNTETVQFALYFCSSYHQFLSIFDRTIERHKKGLTENYITDRPFVSMHAVPVNDSGTFLLWCLMEYSPIETEDIIRNSLMAQNNDFKYQTNRLYPLTYHGKRVFLGYTMDVGKINRVLEDHLDGQDFYICCFPEQTPWYQKLFPGKTIL